MHKEPWRKCRSASPVGCDGKHLWDCCFIFSFHNNLGGGWLKIFYPRKYKNQDVKSKIRTQHCFSIETHSYNLQYSWASDQNWQKNRCHWLLPHSDIESSKEGTGREVKVAAGPVVRMWSTWQLLSPHSVWLSQTVFILLHFHLVFPFLPSAWTLRDEFHKHYLEMIPYLKLCGRMWEV